MSYFTRLLHLPSGQEPSGRQVQSPVTAIPPKSPTNRYRSFLSKSIFSTLGHRIFNTPQSVQESDIYLLRSAGLTFDTMSLTSAEFRPLKKAKVESPKPAPKCVACDETPEDYITPCRSCPDVYCYHCIKKRFNLAIKERYNFPVSCCDRIIHPIVVKNLIPQANYDLYLERYDEHITIRPFYCPVNTCSKFIPKRQIPATSKSVTCPACSTDACINCRKTLEDGHICAKDSEADLILSKYKYKKCPRCDTALLKMFGCNHMRCICGAHWCWSCRRPKTVCEQTPCDGQEDAVDDEPDNEEEDDDDDSSSDSDPDDADADADARIPAHDQAAEPESTTPNDTAAAPTTTSPAASEPQRPPVTDLDDPATHDWQATGQWFGDEPDDQELDIFGCYHHFRLFTSKEAPRSWFKGFDPAGDTVLECLCCFENVTISAKSAERVRERVWDCTSCGIVCCNKCKGEVVGRLQTWLGGQLGVDGE